MSKLEFKNDNAATRLVIGGYAAKKDDDKMTAIYKILGIYKEVVETFDIKSKEITIINVEELIPLKLTIDGLDVAKESYRIFISNLDKDYSYTVRTFLTKPAIAEKVDVIDIRLLNNSIFNQLSDKNVTIVAYDEKHKNYIARTSTNVEIFLRRQQFMRSENSIQIAYINDINAIELPIEDKDIPIEEPVKEVKKVKATKKTTKKSSTKSTAVKAEPTEVG